MTWPILHPRHGTLNLVSPFLENFLVAPWPTPPNCSEPREPSRASVFTVANSRASASEYGLSCPQQRSTRSSRGRPTADRRPNSQVDANARSVRVMASSRNCPPTATRPLAMTTTVSVRTGAAGDPPEHPSRAEPVRRIQRPQGCGARVSNFAERHIRARRTGAQNGRPVRCSQLSGARSALTEVGLRRSSEIEHSNRRVAGSGVDAY